MARIKVATQSDLEQTNSNVQDLQSDVQDPSSGLKVKTQQNNMGIQNLYNIIGPSDDSSGLRKRIYDNEFSIADPTYGLIKKTDDINDVVGTSQSTGLQGRVGSLEDDVKSVGGLNDKVTSLENQVGGLSFNNTDKRYTQDAAPTATASDDRHLLTKKDGDELYGNSQQTGSNFTEIKSWRFAEDANDVEFETQDATYPAILGISHQADQISLSVKSKNGSSLNIMGQITHHAGAATGQEGANINHWSFRSIAGANYATVTSEEVGAYNYLNFKFVVVPRMTDDSWNVGNNEQLFGMYEFTLSNDDFDTDDPWLVACLTKVS